MIDLHNHILPGIDDGPSGIAESIASAETAVADGVRIVAATPHLREDYPGVRPSELSSRCTELSARLRERGVDVQVVCGGEVDLLWAQEASTEELKLVSYAQRGTDLLIETPYGFLPRTFEQLLFRVAVRGYRLILAHPERSPTFQREPQRLAGLVQQGVLIQLTAGALMTSRRGSSSGGLAKWLVKHQLAHIVASDAHGSDVLRSPLSHAAAALEPLAGDRAGWMVNEAPAAVLAGEPIPEAPDERPRRDGSTRRSLWRSRS